MQYAGDTALAAAVDADHRRLRWRALVDWNQDGLFTHPESDLTPWLKSVEIDRALDSDTPVEVSLVEGSAMAEATLTLGGRRDDAQDPMGAPGDAARTLSPYRPDSLLWRRARVGGPGVVIDFGIVVDDGPEPGIRWMRQFTGQVRNIRTRASTREVQLTALDPADKLRAPITLPVWAQPAEIASRTPGRVFNVNTQWLVHFVLERNGVLASPAPRPEALWAVSGHGGWPAEVGTSFAGPELPSEVNAAVRGTAPWWVPGPYGMLAGRGTWGGSPTHRYATTGRVRMRPSANGLGISGFVRIGGIMDPANRSLSRPVVEVRPSGEVGREGYKLVVFENGQVGGVASGTAGSGLITRDVSALARDWYFVGVFFRLLADNRVQMTLRVNGATTAATSTSALTLSGNWLPTAEVMLSSVAGFAKMQTWWGPPPPASGPWPEEAAFTAACDIGVGVNAYTHLPEVVDAESWPLLVEGVGAEYGIVGADETGRVGFRPRSQRPNITSVEKDVATDTTLKDFSITESADSVRNVVSLTTQTVRASPRRATIYSNDDPFLMQSPPGVWSYDVDLPAGVIPPYRRTLPKISAETWRDQTNGFVAVQATNSTVELPSGVAVEFYALSARRGRFVIYNVHASGVRFVTPTDDGGAGTPAFRLDGRVLAADPTQVRYRRSEGSIAVHRSERLFPIPPSRFRNDPEVLLAVQHALVSQMSMALPVITDLEVVGDPRVQITDTLRARDPRGIAPSLRASIVSIRRNLTVGRGLVDRYGVRAIAAPGLGVLNDPELGRLDSSFVLAP